MRSGKAPTGRRPLSSSSGTITAAGTTTPNRRRSTSAGLGIRVPCLIISPYAKQGYVSHVQYEYGSILRFIEEVFGLPPGAIGPQSQGYTDGRAASLDDAFDFTQKSAQVPLVLNEISNLALPARTAFERPGGYRITSNVRLVVVDGPCRRSAGARSTAAEYLACDRVRTLAAACAKSKQSERSLARASVVPSDLSPNVFSMNFKMLPNS